MLELAWVEHCHCSHIPLLRIITECIVMSGIIGSDTTKYVATQINCRFQQFFKSNVITCPVQLGENGISHSYSWKNHFLPTVFLLVHPYVMWGDCFRNKQGHAWELLLQLHHCKLCSAGFLGQIK